jgi:hypothetical protein
MSYKINPMFMGKWKINWKRLIGKSEGMALQGVKK